MNGQEPKSEILSEKHALLIRLTALLLMGGLIWWMFSGNKKPSSGNSSAAADSTSGIIPVCSDAGTVLLGRNNLREATISVRKDCLSSLVTNLQPEYYDLKIDKQGNVTYYIFRNGKYVGTFSSLRDANRTLNLRMPQDAVRLAGYDGIATVRLAN